MSVASSSQAVILAPFLDDISSGVELREGAVRRVGKRVHVHVDAVNHFSMGDGQRMGRVLEAEGFDSLK